MTQSILCIAQALSRRMPGPEKIIFKSTEIIKVFTSMPVSPFFEKKKNLICT